MCRYAKKGKIDAIMFWKFERLARDNNHAVMIKMLLRRQYKLKLFCVEGFSEDADGSPYTALMEQLLAIVAAFYSKNLSSETKRGKEARAKKGYSNASVAPLGYILVKQEDGTSQRPAGLYGDPEIAPIVRRGFELYSTGEFSDATKLARWFNEHEPILSLREGKQPVGKEMARDLLRNRVYTGQVAYTPTEYVGEEFGKGKRSSRGRKRWIDEKHEAVVSKELFDQCQAIRQFRGSSLKGGKPKSKRTYLLNDRVYCARCVSRKHLNEQA